MSPKALVPLLVVTLLGCSPGVAATTEPGGHPVELTSAAAASGFADPGAAGTGEMAVSGGAGQTDASAPDACTPSSGRGFAQSWRAPLPPAEVYNPPGQKRVGLQAGHWLNEERPPELSRLSPGTSGGGLQEWEVNLDIALRTAALLEAEGIAVDVLPTTVPPGYRAHAFISIHADGDLSGRLTGYKIARPDFSSIPHTDDRLVGILNEAYGPLTGLARRDEQISIRMRYYYAFNSRRYCHSVAPGVPQAIVEAGFLTSAADRTLLVGNPDLVARAIARGILSFLHP